MKGRRREHDNRTLSGKDKYTYFCAPGCKVKEHDHDTSDESKATRKRMLVDANMTESLPYGAKENAEYTAQLFSVQGSTAACAADAVAHPFPTAFQPPTRKRKLRKLVILPPGSDYCWHYESGPCGDSGFYDVSCLDTDESVVNLLTELLSDGCDD